MTAEPQPDRRIGAEIARLAPEGALGVAVSGGGDSMALALAAFRWARAAGRRVAAATVDHRLRPESAAEAENVAAFCAGAGIAHRTLVWDDRPARGNLAAAGREARFRLLGDWARERGLSAVLLGHTLDDQAETVLMRLARGSGADGLSGMSDRIWRDGIWWLRPVLGFHREELRAWLVAEGLDWIDDPSNDDPAYDRIKARQALAALAPMGVSIEGLAETARRLARQRQVLERSRAGLAVRARHWGPTGAAWLDVPQMAQELSDTALGMFADTLLTVGAGPYRPRYKSLERVWSDILSGEFTGASLAGCLIEGSGVGIVVYREPAACGASVPLAEGAVWDKRWRLSLAGPWPEGKFGPLGAGGLAALKSAGSDAIAAAAGWSETPHKARLVCPAVFDSSGALLAVPQLGYRGATVPAKCSVSVAEQKSVHAANAAAFNK